ncbi:MAG: putative adenylylsulfate reductase-associated electron transfer protein QmoB [Ignavibacteria bacterium]|nr:putative adenylylsulfate reductase-associated electron transfer protein QmoB [Ignavibacteria bacterium]
MSIETKVGVYICSGCDIAKSIDIEKLSQTITKDTKVELLKTNQFLCSTDAITEIRNDIINENLNRVVIAGCSPRVKIEEFDFSDVTTNLLTERVNIRELVAWSHTPNDEETESLAEDYIKMGIARTRNLEPAEPFIQDTCKDILVIGGGVSGLNTSLSIAEAGYKVILVEKEDTLGGWVGKWKSSFPLHFPFTSLEQNNIPDLINQVVRHENIKVYKSSTIEKITGQPGQFTAYIKNGSITEVNVGSVVQATGWKPYDPNKLSHLGYGKYKNIVTNVMIEEMVKSGNGIKKPSDGKTPKSVAFIQCAGSRDENHLPYCSSVCCRTSLKQALYINESQKDTKIFILYKDIRTPGESELFYKQAQQEENIFLTKGEVESITEEANELVITLSDTLFGENVVVRAEMVVLATGMVPSTYVDPFEENEENKLTSDGKKEAAGAEQGAKILNLTYRQGTDLPTLKYGFPDSHFICFPYETRRTAIYATGCVREPMDSGAAENDALGAAMKAIQAVELISQGKTLLPRVGDLSYPEFFLQRCTQCKRCTEECPFGTLDEDEKGTPKPNPNRCRRCGICMGACPERIISFKNYSVHSISAMIKSIDIPEEDEEKFRIIGFVCENDAYPALDASSFRHQQFDPAVRFIPVRCLGSVNTIWINDALSNGFDGILLMGCKHGDDYQCHFIRGSELANTRMENVQEKLKQLVLEPERVKIEIVAIDDALKIPDMINDFVAQVKDVGQNPYKDM